MSSHTVKIPSRIFQVLGFFHLCANSNNYWYPLFLHQTDHLTSNSILALEHSNLKIMLTLTKINFPAFLSCAFKVILALVTQTVNN